MDLINSQEIALLEDIILNGKNQIESTYKTVPACRVSIEKVTEFVLSDLLLDDRPFLLDSLKVLSEEGVCTEGLSYFVKFIDQQLKPIKDEESAKEGLEKELQLIERATLALMRENNEIALEQLRAHVNRMSTQCEEVRDKFYSLTFPISSQGKDLS
jgi:hypothetical protein